MAAETNGDGKIELIGTTNTGVISSTHQTAPNSDAWTPWKQIDGALSSVAVARNQDGRLELFGATGNAVFRRSEKAPGSDSWNGWQQFPGYLSTVAAETNTIWGITTLIGDNNTGVTWATSQTEPNADTWYDWQSPVNSPWNYNPLGNANNTVCALTADGTAVWRYDGFSWTQIGQGATTRLYGGGYGLYAQTDRGFERWVGVPFNWQVIGGGGNSTWAVSGEAVYGLPADHSGVWKWTWNISTGGSWTQVGGPAANLYVGAWSTLYGGIDGVFATTPDGSGISQFLGSPFNWRFLRRPGSTPALTYGVTGNGLYGVTGDSRMWRWTDDKSPNGRWDPPAHDQSFMSFVQVVGGARGNEAYGVTGDGYLIKLDDSQLTNLPDSPFLIGDANRDVVADNLGGVYAASPQRDSIWKWSHSHQSWTKVSDLATRQLVVCP